MKQHKLKDLIKYAASSRDRRIYEKVWKLGQQQERLLKQIDQPVWRSFNGEVHTPNTLDNNYLLNLIKFLQRQRETDSHFFKCAVLEACKRGLIP